MEAIGKKEWIVPGGHIPLKSNGKEPEFLSQDLLSILNTNNKPIEIAISVFYNDKSPIGSVKIKIQAQRVRKIRINDIINPLPVPLETDYALFIKAEDFIVVQFTKMHTGLAQAATMGTMAFGIDL